MNKETMDVVRSIAGKMPFVISAMGMCKCGRGPIYGKKINGKTIPLGGSKGVCGHCDTDKTREIEIQERIRSGEIKEEPETDSSDRVAKVGKLF